ncbi:hypothetical protein, partial [Promicromonospora soli]|uniref:hypothetical protein n=1 Tax=Promicromonospora soli TaxID=2035533 RepID=UPI001E32AB35
THTVRAAIFPITSLPGAVPQTYQALSDFSKSSPASWPGEFFEYSKEFWYPIFAIVRRMNFDDLERRDASRGSRR